MAEAKQKSAAYDSFRRHKIRPSCLKVGDEIVYQYDVLTVTEAHPDSGGAVVYGTLRRILSPVDNRCPGVARTSNTRIRMEFAELNINYWPNNPESVWREGVMVDMRDIEPLPTKEPGNG